MPPREAAKDIAIQFYSWEGDPCRLYKNADGMDTADIYHAGRGVFSINPIDLLFCAVQISEEAYDEIILQRNSSFVRRLKE